MIKQGIARIGSVIPGGTPGSVLFVDANNRLAEDNANLFWDDAQNFLGIGTINPDSNLNIAKAGADAEAQENIDTYSTNGARYTRIRLRKSNTNTLETLIETDADDVLGKMSFQGIDATPGFDHGAQIYAVQSAASGAFVPAKLYLEAFDADGAWSNQLVLSDDGNVGIGTATPGFPLEVIGSASIVGSFYRNDTSTHPQLRCEQDGTGDASLAFTLTGGQSYCMGIDNSASNVFRISPSANLYFGTNDFVMNSNSNIGINVFPSPSYRLYVQQAKTDDTSTAIRSEACLKIESSIATKFAYGMSFDGRSDVDTAITNAGTVFGIFGAAIHDSLGTLSGGTDSGVVGARITYGSQVDAGSMDSAIGIRINALLNATITDSYDIKIDAPTGEVSPTNEWVLYSNHVAPSRLIDDLHIDDDNKSILFGAAQDAGITYDGTDLIFDSQLVGSGDFRFLNGNVGIHHADPCYALDIFSNTGSEVRLASFGNTSTGFFGFISFDYSGATVFRINSFNTPFLLGQQGEDLMSFGDHHTQIRRATAVMDYGSPWLRIGVGGFTNNSYRNIGFGYVPAFTAVPPCEIGYQQKSATGYGKGDFVIAVRDTTGQTDNAVERYRVKSNGDLWQTADNQYIKFGASQDAGITYDGDDMVLNPRLVGTGQVAVLGAIRSGQLTITTANDGAGIDVSGVNSIIIDSSGGAIGIEDLTGGVAGQIIHFVVVDNTSAITFTDQSGSNQELILHAEANLVIAANDRGGVTLICDGTKWYGASHAKHV